METPEFIRKLEEQIHAAVAERHLLAQVNVINVDDTPNHLDPTLNFTQIAFETLYADKSWICAEDKLYYHTGNHYKHSPDSEERPRIADFCNSFAITSPDGKSVTYPYATPAHVKKVLEWAKMLVEINPELINPPGINCTNGIVRPVWIGKQVIPRLDPHTPKDYFIYEPLIEYDPNADDTYCEQLLACLDQPQQEIFLRNVAASLDLKTVRKFRGREVKAMFAIGLGSNGKDALRECVSTIYGKNGLTSVSLGDFQSYDEGRKFGLAPLIYSRVNWASENPQTSRIDRLQSLKLFITGDTLHCEHKGKDHIEFSSNAIGIFNLNETPAFQGVMQAIKDRIAILEFKKTFVDNPDPNNSNEIKGDPRFRYDPEFIRTHVAPAFLNRMLKALNNLIESGIDYECTTDAFRNLQKENNHLFDFIEDEKLGYVEGGEMSASALWMLLTNWYIQNGTLTIDENIRRTWIDQVRKSDKNVKGINQIIARIAQLFPKAVRATRYCEIRKKQIPILKGIGIIENTRPIIENTRPIPAPLPAPEIQSQQATRPTRPSFSNFGENIGEESDMKIELLSPTMKKEEYATQSGAGEAEPLQDLEIWGGNWGETGAGSSQSGAGSSPSCAEKLESGAGQSDVPSSENSKVLASEALACILESPNPSWEVIKDILGEMEIASYSELHGFLTLGEFTQLEMLVRAADQKHPY